MLMAPLPCLIHNDTAYRLRPQNHQAFQCSSPAKTTDLLMCITPQQSAIVLKSGDPLSISPRQNSCCIHLHRRAGGGPIATLPADPCPCQLSELLKFPGCICTASPVRRSPKCECLCAASPSLPTSDPGLSGAPSGPLPPASTCWEGDCCVPCGVLDVWKHRLASTLPPVAGSICAGGFLIHQ